MSTEKNCRCVAKYRFFYWKENYIDQIILIEIYWAAELPMSWGHVENINEQAVLQVN